jgi:SAM-dependent methyltransferase
MQGSPGLATVVTDPASPLPFTGERYTPDVSGMIGYEHWHRYAIAASIVAGCRVLDAACGEGYGSARLACVADSVVGVDMDAASIRHATRRYARDNLAYVRASVTALPLADASVDVVVSFETIEHLHAQESMLAEFRRVLAPGGALILSSPNRPVYNAGAEATNPFHVRELDRGELAALLDPCFPQQAWHGQNVCAQSVLWAQSQGGGEVAYVRPDGAATEPAPAMYFIVVAGSREAVLPTLPVLSMYDDGTLALGRAHDEADRRVRQLHLDLGDARKVGEERLAELVASVNALSSERQKTATLAARVATLEAENQRLAGALAGERGEHAHTRARLAYRESAAGWARWPLGAARRRLGGARS